MRIAVLIPVFNDWESLDLLIEQINASVSAEILKDLSFVIINDCSPEDFDPSNKHWDNPSILIQLNKNVGHQKAIAIGLSHLSIHGNIDAVIVMDADGEDKPEDIPRLIHALKQNPSRIYFGRRAKRSESIVFRFFYRIYKILFKALTGHAITFGNFSIIPFSALYKLTHVSEIWNHFSGGIIRSRLRYDAIPVERGKRLAGKSKMNFTSLVLHGLSAVSVHIDTVAVRLLISTLLLMLMSVVCILIVIYFKFFTTLIIPGWATTVILSMVIVLVQAMLFSASLVFLVLNYRTQRLFIPAKHYEDFIQQVDSI